MMTALPSREAPAAPAGSAHAYHELGREGAVLFDRLRQRLETFLSRLPDKPEETPDSALRCLWHLAHGTALSADAATLQPLPPLTGPMESVLNGLIERRLAGVPLAHLCGRQRFLGLELLAGPQALIPRRETELLGLAAVDALQQRLADSREAVTAMDICTGSGNLAVAMAKSDPRVRVLAADLSEAAVELAQRNVDHLGLRGQVELRVGDLLAPFDAPEFHGTVDVLTCNPPYISTKKLEVMPSEIIQFEPREAFDGGALGVGIMLRLIREAPRWLRQGGWLLFEVGHGQGAAAGQRLARSDAYDSIRSLTDAGGEVRALMARRR